MKAALLVKPRQIEIRDIPEPQPGPRDVLIRNDAVGVCGSDIHIFQGHMNWNLDEAQQPIPLQQEPQVLGHEIAGTVMEIGSAVDDLSVGDRVIVDQGLNCSSQDRTPFCEYCASGFSHHCEHYLEHGITGLPGGFADLIAIPAVNAIRINGDLSMSEAAMTEPLGCVLHSLDLMAQLGGRYRINAPEEINRVRSILVCGGGPAGQLFIQALRSALGFEGRMLMSDPDPGKRNMAEAFGARTIDPSGDESVPEFVARETSGRLCEIVVDACGVPAMWQEFARCIRKQGTGILYGFGRERGAGGTLDELQWRGASLVATSGASGPLDPDGRPAVYRRALQYLEDGLVDTSKLFTHRYEDWNLLDRALGSDPETPGYLKGVFLVPR